MKSFVRTFDLAHGALGAIGMGAILFAINATAGYDAGLQAALAQATISFLIVGTNTGVFKKLFTQNKLMAILVPTLFTTLIASLIHYATGTAEFGLSVLSVFFLGAFHFALLSQVYTRYGTVDPLKLFSL